MDQVRLLYKETTRTEIYQVFFPHFWTTQRKIPKNDSFDLYIKDSVATDKTRKKKYNLIENRLHHQ